MNGSLPGRGRILADRTEDGKHDDMFDIYEYAGPERLTRLMRHTRFPHIEITSTWAFVAVPDGTRLYVTMEVAPRGIVNVLAPLIYLDMTKRAAWVLARLTRVLERRELSSTDGARRQLTALCGRPGVPRGRLPSRRSTSSQPLTEGSGASQVDTGLAPLCVATS